MTANDSPHQSGPPLPRPEDLEESAEDLYEHAPCGYISTRLDGTLIKVNSTFTGWLGYTREELLSGKRFQELLAGGARIFHETHYVPLLRMQGSVHEINFELVTKSGQRVPVLVNTVQKKNAAGQPVLYRTTLFTITDRKSYERELLVARKRAESAAQAKADFLSMMSHEIRTPMNAIIGLASLLMQTELSPQQQKYTSILHASSENLLGLLNNLLDFSKIEAGKTPLEQRAFELRQLIYGTLYGLSVKAEEKQLALRLELDERLPSCLVGDPVKLGQVITNLVSNALKFTDKGGVTLAVRVQEQHAEEAVLDFHVTDTGIGIAEDRLASVFEGFTQASYDIGLKYGGTGLGLFICQKLLHLHGSRLEVRSTLGQGSTFSFTLRMKLGHEPAESVGLALRAQDANTLRGIRVLVAEDNGVNVFVLSQFLRRWGVHFDVVGNGRMALERLQEHPYELVLMDLQMPEMSGDEATRAVRALPEERLQRLPIIALTASNRLDLEERLDSAGFTDFVGKPFQPEELFTKLAVHCGRTGGETSTQDAPVLAPEPAPEDAGVAADPPGISLEKFWSLAEGDPEAILELSTITIHNAEAQKHDFLRALEANDREAFEFHAHKVKMMVDLLQAQGLRDALQVGRRLLTEQESLTARRSAVIQGIQQELDAIISVMKEEVRRVG